MVIRYQIRGYNLESYEGHPSIIFKDEIGLSVIAENEEEALRKAPNLIKRDKYRITEAEELDVR